MTTTALHCGACGIQLKGTFSLPRLARLNKDALVLAESLILSGGNLKELAVELDVSYPTLRKRLDQLIDQLMELKRQDNQKIQQWLDAVESGDMNAEEASRLIEELNFGR